MKSILKGLIIILLFANCSMQNKVIFDVQKIFIDKLDEKKEKSNFFNKNEIFYEDADYIVTRTCSGEWGGSIWFKNKMNGIEYSCKAVCPVAVNLIHGKYFVTNSLAHLDQYYSEIIEIRNPELMTVFKPSEPIEIKGGLEYRHTGDLETKSRKGIKVVWSESGIMSICSFQYKGKLYNIMSKNGKTFLTTIKDNKLKILNQILEEQIWHSDTYKDEKGNLIIPFENDKINGYIEIKGNLIKIIIK